MSLKIGITFTTIIGASIMSLSASAVTPVISVPKGFQAGRDGATYGTYNSVFSENAQNLQKRLFNLENRVMGLSKISMEDPVMQSEAIYLLEAAIMKMNLDVANSSSSQLTGFEKHSMLYATSKLYSYVRTHAERLFEDMVRFIDVKLPGPNGLQFRTELSLTLENIYLPNYRSDIHLTQSQRDHNYQQKVAEFISKGGSLSELKVFSQAEFQKMKSYTRVEYVVRENGELWMTEGTAGHVLLAGGGAVKSAGQFIVLKDHSGRATMLILTNASGNFKPDIFSAQQIADQLGKQLGLEYWQVIVTKGEPFTNQAIKVYSKGAQIDKSITQERLKRYEYIESKMKELDNGSASRLSCSQVLN